MNKIKDFDGISHGLENPNENVKSNYKYQGLIDINADGVKEDIFTNAKSGRWATCSIEINTGIAN